jgi:tetratricopeptide (TPR) repeat protein
VLENDRTLAGLALVARAAADAGWHARAGELFAEAATRALDAPLWLEEAAMAYANAGKPEPALAYARRLVASCPNSDQAHMVLASVLDKQGKAEAALDAYEQAFRVMNRGAVGLRRTVADRLRAAGRFEGAIEAYRSVLDATPDDRAVAQALALLYAAHKPDKLAEAERLAVLAAKGDPSDPAARDALGWVYFLAKKPDPARAEIVAAIALEPRNATSYYHLGMVDFVRGRRDAARRALRIALALDPKLPEGDTVRSTLKAIEEQEKPGPAPPPAKP